MFRGFVKKSCFIFRKVLKIFEKRSSIGESAQEIPKTLKHSEKCSRNLESAQVLQKVLKKPKKRSNKNKTANECIHFISNRKPLHSQGFF